MILKYYADLLAGHSLRGSLQNFPQGDTAVVQMKDVDPESGIDKIIFIILL